MWKAYKAELKHNVFNSLWKFIKFGGILLLPLIYGFMYIFAFFDPFVAAKNLNITMISSANDPFAKAFIEKLNSNKDPLHLGDLNIPIHINQVYASEKNLSNSQWREKEAEKYYSTILIKPSPEKKYGDTLTYGLASALFSVNHVLEDTKLTLQEKFDKLLSDVSKMKMFSFYINYKKNFIVAMGTGFSGSTEVMYKRMLLTLFTSDMSSVWKMMNNPELYNGVYHLNNPAKDKIIKNSKNFWKELVKNKTTTSGKTDTQLNLLLKNLQTVQVHSQMGEFAEYGYGLAPFFISLAMWIGSMGLTLTVSSKIVTKGFSKIKVYLAKLFTVWLAIAAGGIILVSTLGLIGFADLGVGFGRIYMQTIISGILLSSIVFGIRAAIPNETVGIITVLLLLVLQMVVSGGLFATSLQDPIFRWLHYIFPYTYSVNALREMTYDPVWTHWLMDVSIMVLFSVVVSIICCYFWIKRHQKSEMKPKEKISSKEVAHD